jgi:DNA-binding transcriptional LysR family regulator
MLENLKALECIAEVGSMTLAAKKMFISQPAISKRIASLEFQFGQKLIEKVGTGIRLTPYGTELVHRSAPLIRKLEMLIHEEQEEARGNISVNISSSIMLSWGARAIRMLKYKLPDVNIRISSGITASAIDQVISGEITVALVPSYHRQSAEIVVEEVVVEPFVIVPSQLKPFKISKKETVPLISVPSHSETGTIVHSQLKALNKQHGLKFEIDSTLLHFFEVAQAAKEGLGHGIVPLGITKALSIPESKLVQLPRPGISVSNCMVVRKSSLALPVVNRFCVELVKSVREIR